MQLKIGMTTQKMRTSHGENMPAESTQSLIDIYLC